MWQRGAWVLRSVVGPLNAAPRPRLRQGKEQQQQPRGLCVAAAAAAGGAGLGLLRQAGSRLLGGGALLGGSAALVASSKKDDQETETEIEPWLAELSGQEGSREVLTAGQQFRKGPLGKLVLEQDHLFEVMEQTQQIKEFRCFYQPNEKRFYSVVRLGKEVCGFPQVVHGGLTAAIVDETFGGLGLCLWRSGALGVRPPAYTARLEVDYMKKIPAGSTILCTTELEKVEEGRKIWMTAEVSDGKGTVYAKSRALFVAPRIEKVLFGWLPWARGKGGRGE